jgi:soluble lytic murein transglycosylase-like protein
MNVHSDHHWPQGSGPYREMIQDAAHKYGVPVLLLAWLLWEESHFRDDIIKGRERSAVGALGIAQFMPDTARDTLGSEELALVPSEAIPGAARFLARMYGNTGSWRNALAAYNWGVGNVLQRGR